MTTESAEKLPPYVEGGGVPSSILQTIQEELKGLSPELRQLSLDIWSTCNAPFSLGYSLDVISFSADHPEVMYEERSELS